MNTRSALGVAALVLGLSFVLGLAPQNTSSGATHAYSVDSVHSTALFRVHHAGAGQLWGRFNTVEGGFDYADGSADNLAFDVTIPIASIDTNNAKRDGHLKSPDFFNAKEFPTMRFQSTSAKQVGKATYEVTGDLTMHGVTKPVKAAVEWTGSANRGMGNRCGFEAIFSIKRGDFGVRYGLNNGVVGDEVQIIVSIEGTRK